MIVLLTSVLSFADTDDLRDVINSRIGSTEAVKTHLLSPMINGGEMSTFDGSESFTTGGDCKNSNNFLDVVGFPSPTGDISQLKIQQDLDWDGNLDTLTNITTRISGVCANGIISCSAGTWDSCQSHQWVLSADNTPSLTPVALSKLGGCYCINNSCGQALMLKNSGEVMGHIGTAIASLLAQHNPTLIIADSYAKEIEIKFLGGLSEQCDLEGSTGQQEFYDNTASLRKTAMTTSTLDSLFGKITTGAAATDSSISTHSCVRNRILTIDEATVNDIILYDGGAGGISSCGEGCLKIVLGTVGDNYWQGGSCGLFKHQVKFWVARPDLILSAKLLKAKFDDHIQISVNDKFIWSHEANWTDISNNSYPPSATWYGGNPYCERSTGWDVVPNIDFKSAINTFGSHEFGIRVAVSGGGEGYAYAELMVEETCELKPDVIEDSCATYANDTACDLIWESIDGITTVDNYTATGLKPLPTTRTINGKTCSHSVIRPWWRRERSYKCRSEKTYDFTNAMKRKATVSASVSDTGFDDFRLNEKTNTWESHVGIGLEFPEFPQSSTCEKTCKTRIEIEADEVAGMGPETDRLTTEKTIEYRYHTCDSNDVCPTGSGETVISPCGCNEYFMDATLQMQAGRLAGRDTVCTSGVPSPL